MNTTTTPFAVTQEQIDACERVIDETNHQVFYIVASTSNPGTHYKVIYNRQFGCLQCLPFDGEPCPASVKGLTCWHKRAALAAEAEYKALKRAERQAEQRQVEATEQYQQEQLQFTIEVASRKLTALEAEENGDQEAADREHAAVAVDGLRAYERKPFQLMR